MYELKSTPKVQATRDEIGMRGSALNSHLDNELRKIVTELQNDPHEDRWKRHRFGVIGDQVFGIHIAVPADYGPGWVLHWKMSNSGDAIRLLYLGPDTY